MKIKVLKSLTIAVAIVLLLTVLVGCAALGRTLKPSFPLAPSDDSFIPAPVVGRYDFLSSVHRQEGDLVVHYLDVGHGDAIFIQFPDETTMLIDGGSGELFYNPSKYIRDYIETVTDSKTIDYIFLSHPHIDHCNALRDIVSWFEVSNFYVPKIDKVIMNTKAYTNFYDAMEGVVGAKITDNIDVLELSDIFTIYGPS